MHRRRNNCRARPIHCGGCGGSKVGRSNWIVRSASSSRCASAKAWGSPPGGAAGPASGLSIVPLMLPPPGTSRATHPKGRKARGATRDARLGTRRSREGPCRPSPAASPASAYRRQARGIELAHSRKVRRRYRSTPAAPVFQGLPQLSLASPSGAMPQRAGVRGFASEDTRRRPTPPPLPPPRGGGQRSCAASLRLRGHQIAAGRVNAKPSIAPSTQAMLQHPRSGHPFADRHSPVPRKSDDRHLTAVLPCLVFSGTIARDGESPGEAPEPRPKQREVACRTLSPSGPPPFFARSSRSVPSRASKRPGPSRSPASTPFPPTTRRRSRVRARQARQRRRDGRLRAERARGDHHPRPPPGDQRRQ